MNFKFLDKNKGFTPHHFSLKNSEGYIGIPELLVVMAIMAILTAVALINYPAAKKQLALQRSASQMAQDIRRVQEMALASKLCPVELSCSGQVPSGGYGIYLREAPAPQESYVLFADEDDDRKCSGCISDSGEFIERIFFEGGEGIIKIKDLDSPNVNIIFVPPDPITYLTDGAGALLAGNQASIVLSLISDETKTKTIIINKAGLIYVE